VTLVRYDEAPARGWVELLAPAAELARVIAPTDFVPRSYRNNPAAITAAILYGDEVGVGPMLALNKIRVIDGTPYVYAEVLRGLVLAAGHSLWPSEKSNTRVEWCGRRRGEDEVSRVAWSMDDARRAHLDGRPNWRSYPRAMLSARASAELCRDVFPDAIGGLRAIEERDDGDTVEPADVVEVPRPNRRRRKPLAAVSAVSDVEAVQAAPERPAASRPLLPGEDETDAVDGATPALMTDPQRRRMMATFRELGIRDRGERLRLVRDVVGRPELASSSELTVAQAADVLDHLETLRPPENAVDDSPPATDPEAATSADEDAEP
jgi:hypothetical protein